MIDRYIDRESDELRAFKELIKNIEGISLIEKEGKCE